MFKRILGGLLALPLVLAAQNIDASRVRYLNPVTGALTRTSQSRFADSRSVKDFGAKGDGVTDDAAAFQAAVNSIANGAYGTVYCPEATTSYKLGSAVSTNGRNVSFVLSAGCRFSGTGSIPINYVKFDSVGTVVGNALTSPQVLINETSAHLVGTAFEVYNSLGAGTFIQAPANGLDVNVGSPGGGWARAYRVKQDLTNSQYVVFTGYGNATTTLNKAIWGIVDPSDPGESTDTVGITSTRTMYMSGSGDVTQQQNFTGLKAITAGGTFTAQSNSVFGGTGVGVPGTSQLYTSPGGGVSSRLSFGTDGTDWTFNFGKNQAGSLTDFLILHANPSGTSANVFVPSGVSIKAASGYTFNDNTVQTTAACGPTTAVTSGPSYTVLAATGACQTILASGNTAVQLYSASTRAGWTVTVKKTDTNANTITITSAGGTMDSFSTLTLVRQYDAYTFVSDGTNWNLI